MILTIWMDYCYKFFNFSEELISKRKNSGSKNRTNNTEQCSRDVSLVQKKINRNTLLQTGTNYGYIFPTYSSWFKIVLLVPQFRKRQSIITNLL